MIKETFELRFGIKSVGIACKIWAISAAAADVLYLAWVAAEFALIKVKIRCLRLA